MGPSFLDLRLSWFRFSLASGWDTALSCGSSPLCTRAPTRARWLSSGLVRRSHRPLSRLSPARSVSRAQFQRQAATGERGLVVPANRPLGCFCSSTSSSSSLSSCGGTLERLASLWHPTSLAQAHPQPNGSLDKWSPPSTSCQRTFGRLHASPTRSLASLMGAAPGTQCPSA